MRLVLIGAALACGLSGTTASALAAPLLASEFPARVLAAHNRERANVGVAPLVWDSALGNSAAAYAQRMAMSNVFQHSDRRARRGVGENLWMGTRGAFSVEAMVGQFIGEKRYFRPGIFPNNSVTGNWADVAHYTQLIWQTTQRVGCALASNGRTDYLVCHYGSAGNIDGRWVGRQPVERG